MSRQVNSDFSPANGWKIDDRLWLSDISISQDEVMKQYQKYIANHEYDNAKNYIEQHEEVFVFGMWIMSLMKDRIMRLGQYITNFIAPNKPTPTNYYSTETKAMNAGIEEYDCWISGVK